MPRLALVLGLASIACSLSVIAFFVGVPFGLVAVILALSALRYPEMRTRSLRALVAGSAGLGIGLLVWFVHVRAIQTAYRMPARSEIDADFAHAVASSTAPLPGAPPRSPTPPKDPR